MKRRAIALSLLLALLLGGTATAQVTDDRSAAARQQRVERLAASWRDGPLTLGEATATATMLLAIGLLALTLGGTGVAGSAIRLDRQSASWLIGAAAVLAWSVAVRFGLTQPNILTDGGSGYTRLMRYVEGYGGVAVLVKLLPAEWAGFMWHAMVVPRALAALVPMLIFWVARELELGLGVALLCGVMLASLPAHAVLTSSDHLEGTMAALQLAGLALVLAARRRERVDLFAAGVALAAWAMWCRPEGGLGLLPLAAAALRFPRRWWGHRQVWAVIAMLIALVLLRAHAMATSSTASLGTTGRPPLSAVAWGGLLFSTIIVPVWIWAPAPFALWRLARQRALLVVLAGLAAGLLPVYLRGLFPEPAGTHLETVRYAIPALGWLALMSAVSLDAGIGWLARRWTIGGSWPLRTAVLLALAAVPLLHREYLARRYGHVASEAVIRQLLAQIPDGCGLAVPDDRPEGASIEIAERYRNIVAEAVADGAVRAIDVVPVSDLLEGKVDAARCWTFLRGPYCYHGFDGSPAIACRQIADRFALEERASTPIEFRHHRLVTGPDVRRAPWYMPSMPLVLYRVGDRKPGA